MIDVDDISEDSQSSVDGEIENVLNKEDSEALESILNCDDNDDTTPEEEDAAPTTTDNDIPSNTTDD